MTSESSSFVNEASRASKVSFLIKRMDRPKCKKSNVAAEANERERSPNLNDKNRKKADGAKVSGRDGKACGADKGTVPLCAGILLTFFAIIIHVSWDEILTTAINKELTLTETSKSHLVWVKNVVPLHMDFYFFNWTNPDGIRSPSYKPAFEEVGPYRFEERVEKVNVTWNSNGTVTYKKLKRWFFVREQSWGTLGDNITTLNVIALVAAHTTRNWLSIARRPVSYALSATQNVHVTKRAGEFLFDGYSDPLLDLAASMPRLSSKVPFDRFGWFYKRNGSTDFDGIFNMETGGNGMGNFGKLRYWNYRNNTSFYDGPCSDIKGSAGEFWPPKRSKDEDIYFFAPDMCRYIGLRYKKETIVSGLRGYRYESGLLLFDNGTLDAGNECFCRGECIPSGALNVSNCRFGTPGFISYPHFHLADPSYREAIIGMKPDPERHDMYIVLEPNLGLPLEVAARLQINILLRPDPDIRIYSGVPRIFFPMIWFEQKVKIPEEMVFPVKILLALPTLGMISYIVLYVVGISFILMYACKKCFNDTRYTLSNASK